MCLTATICLSGCAAVSSKQLPSPVIAHKHETLDPALLRAIAGEGDGEAYRVGPGDTLLVAVYGHPELSVSHYAGGSIAGQNARTAGLLVDNDGSIQFPLIGTVPVGGKTSDQLRRFLERELDRYIKEPRVTVQVVFNGSIRYYLLGQFTQPGLKFSDRPLTLLEAIGLGGTIDLDRANLRGAYVARANKRIPVNFRRLLHEGDLGQNIRLRSGDVVFVPDTKNQQAFVFGGSSSANGARGGPVPFFNGRLDLLQALAYVGFGFREQTQARFANTRVIRSDGDRGELITVNVGRILNGEAASFELMPGDVVYVPATALTRWSQAMEQLLPTLQVISGALNPFVQLKYLGVELTSTPSPTTPASPTSQ